MASTMTVTINNNLSVRGDGKQSIDNFASTINTSGSQWVGNSITVSSSYWTTLPSGSNVDFLYGQFYNNDSSGSVYIALSSSNNTASILTPNSPCCCLSYSGSANVYARVMSNYNYPVILGYSLVSFN